MICKIEHYSECEFDKDSSLQINDDIKEGDSLFIAQGHDMIIEHLIHVDRNITIVGGNKILKLKVIS